MDKEKAQFILKSFRPNGQDSADADFQEALQLAVEDLELGQWLADERAEDAKFADALNEIEIPDDLRLSLLAVMNGDSADDPHLHEEMDKLFSNALSDVQPPAGLRDQILAAMDVEKLKSTEVEPQQVEAVESEKVITGAFNRKKWINVAAVAAAVVLGVFLALQIDSSQNSEPKMASIDVQQSAGQLLNEGFSFDVKNDSGTYLSSWLKEQDLPAPLALGALPPGLQGLSSMGCKKVELENGAQASLICYSAEENKSLHLITVNNVELSDQNLPTLDEVNLDNSYHCSLTDWNVVRWRDAENTYILMTKSGQMEREELLQYF